MREALVALQMDVTFNVLLESTLSIPAISIPESRIPNEDACAKIRVPGKSANTGKKAASRGTKSKPVAESSFEKLFMLARTHLLGSHNVQFGSTAQTHMVRTP